MQHYEINYDGACNPGAAATTPAINLITALIRIYRFGKPHILIYGKLQYESDYIVVTI
ncbi:hypothetical protein Riv7116_4710 [Rivularia sp. PCC 7116]|uniref:hypothetical protein n=1 Tax=Rivularia sp. PCC 7116 TaxID=373994 RepID=UPI00029ED77D|nr:hypothetical protein [Rivularia sp. PCC 7116]AFY57126.1 hypothetical protein Riv7116_4710 [Rivularia sp. PCC 7116]